MNDHCVNAPVSGDVCCDGTKCADFDTENKVILTIPDGGLPQSGTYPMTYELGPCTWRCYPQPAWQFVELWCYTAPSSGDTEWRIVIEGPFAQVGTYKSEEPNQDGFPYEGKYPVESGGPPDYLTIERQKRKKPE